MNKTLGVLVVLLATSAAFGSKIKTVKEPTAQLVIMYRHCPSEPEWAAIPVEPAATKATCPVLGLGLRSTVGRQPW
jgi:hypothetical protein